jgi:protein involved in polysaccharide export with SLBB domain
LWLAALAVAAVSAAAGQQKQVSLPVQHILDVLHKDPELVREVKQEVIEQAADEGRIIESSELTDEALFRMVSEDPTVAVLATEAIARKQESGRKSRIPEESDQPTTTREALNTRQETRGTRITAGWGEDAENDASANARYTLGSDGDDVSTATEVPESVDQRYAGKMTRTEDATDDAARDDAARDDAARRDAARDDAAESGNARRSADVRTVRESRQNASEQMKPSGRRGRRESKQSHDDPVFVKVPNPYARVPQLDELYKQVANRGDRLERFGTNVFRNGTGNADDLPMDMPVGPEYVLGPGDGLKIEIWGGVSERLQRVVDREGRVALPETGLVEVAGQSLGEAQQTVLAALRKQFREVRAEMSLTRLRSVRVYVVGDVERPGAYDISALSTPLNALYAAGGPTARGSMRTLRHYRGKQLIQEVDVYDLILHGIHSGLQRLEAGDTVLVPPMGHEIAIDGMVRRPAIYELRDERDLAQALDLAGGVLPIGTLRHIEIQRVEEHEKRTALNFDLPEGSKKDEIESRLAEFEIQDGDKVRVSPIVSYSERSVYLDGHVFNPGKRAWHDGMTVRDLIKSYSDLLPEPYRRHAEIVRLLPPDFRPEVIGFDLGEALEGKAGDVALQPFDTLRVFGKYEFEDVPEIKVTGEVRNPGAHRTNGETRLRDAIFLAGGLTPDAQMESVHVFRKIEGSRMQVIGADLRKAMAGDEAENIVLLPRDQVVVHKNMAKVDPAVVYIGGSVAAPGRYPLGEGMTAAELVRLAGGFRRGAFTESADLTRMSLPNERDGVASETRQVKIGMALAGDKSEDVALRDGDVLAVRQIAGWNDIGASITVRGEVAHPGTYGITQGERLSSVIKRTGGFYRGAYARGAVLTRVEVRQLAEKSKAELIERLQQESASAPQFAAGTTVEEQTSLTKAMQDQRRDVISTLRGQEVNGRLVLRISEDVGKWENTAEDIEVRAGDVLTIPKRPTFVLVSGQVYNRAAITWVPGKTAGWYLRQAGGPTETANKKAIFVVRADGSVVGSGSDLGFWGHNVLDLRLQPGDSVIAPEKVLSTNSTWRSLLGSAQMMSALALTAKVFTGL